MKMLPTTKISRMIQKKPVVELITIFVFLYTLFSLPAIAYSALEGPGSGLVGWWKFDDGSGSSVSDSSGNGNTGTIIGTPSWTTGLIDGAIDLSDNSNFVRIPGSTSLEGHSDKTIAVWVSISDNLKISNSLFGWGRAGATVPQCQDNYRGWVNWHGGFQASYQNTPGETVVRPGTQIGSIGTGELGEWAHYAFVYESAGENTFTISLYKNGALAGTPYTGTDGLSSCGSLTGIGTQEDLSNPAYIRTFSGLMDDFRVYDRALSASEVSELYNQVSPSADTTAPTTPTGLTATAVSSYQIDLSWNASSDDVGVAGYVIYRDGEDIATVRSGTSYSDTAHTIGTIYHYSLSTSTSYTYTVAAFDAAGNFSSQSSSDSATTSSAEGGTYSVSVTIAGTGTSTVASTPAGLSCSNGTCTASFSVGSTVVLIPYNYILGMNSPPDFSAWSGSGSSGNGEYVLLMDSDKTVTATYGSSFPSESPSNADITTGLVGHWKLDEGAGSTTADSSGRGHTGTLVNSPTWVAGKIGPYALSFDGISTYVSIPASSDFNVYDEFTISAWVYPTNPDVRVTAVGRAMGNLWHLWVLEQINTGLGTARFDMEYVTRDEYGDSAHRAQGPAYSINIWHHVVGVKSAGDNIVRIYVDTVEGEVSSPVTETDPSDLDAVPITIGARRTTPDSVWFGYVDDVRFYNRSLSYNEIVELYNYNGNPSPTPSPPTNLRIVE